MGYGEFGGGGSVHWRVRHGVGGGGGAGRDPKPDPGEDGMFQVWVNGVLVATTAVNTGRIIVAWSADLTEPLAQSEAKVNRRMVETTPADRGERTNS